MADINLAIGRNRFFMKPFTLRGIQYIWTTFHAKDIGTDSIVSFNIEHLQDIKEELRRCKIEFDE